MTSFLVSVPATSANLGPGFDCLGLALNLWNQAEFSTQRFYDSSDSNDSTMWKGGAGIRLEIEGFGAETLPRDETNLIVKAARALSARVQMPLPEGVNIRCRNAFPPGSGLGSSSSAILLGLVGANALLNQPLSPAELLSFASEMEGHPDNVTPALLGGLTVSTVHEGQVIARKYSVAPISLAVVIPYFDFSTHAARAALPKHIPLADAVYNLGRTPLVVEALRSGDLTLLAQAMDDRLHQPYRLPLYPGAQTAFDAARAAGASAVAISGAGPGVIAFSENELISQQTATAMSQAFCEAGLDVWAGVTNVAEEGTRVESGVR